MCGRISTNKQLDGLVRPQAPYNTTTGAFLYDNDGNNNGVAVEFARLMSKPALAVDDFIVAS